MPFDGIYISFLCKELNEKLKGAKVLKIYQPGNRDVTVQFRYGSDLFISADPDYPYFCLTDEKKDNPVSPPNFCMLLRKYLTGALLTSIEQQQYERTVKFVFDTVDDMGDTSVKYLIAEVMGKYSNLILTDEKYKILGAIRNETGDISHTVAPGIIYTPIVGRTKISPDDFEKLSSLSPESHRDIVDNVAGISPQVGKMIYDGLKEKPLESQLKSALSDAKPYCFYNENGHLADFSYCILPGYQSVKVFESFSDTVFSYYYNKTKENTVKQRTGDLIKKVSTIIERINKKNIKQEKELKESENAETYKLYADLLTANLYLDSKKSDSIVLKNFYDDYRDITVPLDISKDLKTNASAYYKKYRKLKTASGILKEQLISNRSELEYLNATKFFLENCTNEAEIKEIREELTESGYIKHGKTVRGSNDKAKKSLPQSFVSDSGIKIFVGKNNIQNDRLTFHTAQRDYIWMHVQGAPGSHTVIMARRNEIDDKTLYYAAFLAAKNSSICGKVTVDFTEIKNVRRQPGKKPGMVFYTDYQSLTVSV